MRFVSRRTLLKEAGVLCAALIWGAAAGAQTASQAASSSQAPVSAHRFDLTPAEVADQQNYDQPLRPQFHYTTMQGHIGDATGLVWYRGEYHLFNIFDEWSRKSADHKRWGHAVSTDLIHWTQMPALLDTVIDHAPGSGSGVVDWNNSSGLRMGAEKTLLIFYTDYAKGSSILFSNDRGRSWTRYKNNPVLAGFDDIRDPNVFWYAPKSAWRMIRYEKKGFAFYGSNDLVHWSWLSRVDGYYECPDLFELPVDHVAGESRWVLIDGDGSYVLGRFDGTQFVAESAKLRVEYGTALYATQTWKRGPEEGTYQMAWLRYPPTHDLTWDGQMSFPVKLSLRRTPEGIRLMREPIHEVESLRRSQRVWKDLTVEAGEKTMDGLEDDLLDMQAEIEAAGADEFGVMVHGQRISYSVSRHELRVGDHAAPLTLSANTLRLRILVDRSSMEVFANDGEVTFSLIDLEKRSREVSLFAKGGKARVTRLEADGLESIWSGR